MARTWNPAKHPRDKRGRFKSSGAGKAVGRYAKRSVKSLRSSRTQRKKYESVGKRSRATYRKDLKSAVTSRRNKPGQFRSKGVGAATKRYAKRANTNRKARGQFTRDRNYRKRGSASRKKLVGDLTRSTRTRAKRGVRAYRKRRNRR